MFPYVPEPLALLTSLLIVPNDMKSREGVGFASLVAQLGRC